MSGRARFGVAIFSAFDPRSPQAPRNVQVAEVQLSGTERPLADGAAARQPLQNWEQKAMHKALHFFRA